MTSTAAPARRLALVLAAVALAIALAGVLSGCSPTVPMEPADDAANPACANISVELPELVDDVLEKRQTSAQATAAWGTPATVLFTCGVPVPPPSTLRCVTIGEVDWLVDDSEDSRGVFTTYGRDPAVQVVVDASVPEATVLNELEDAVAVNEAQRACTNAQDATIDQ